MAIRLRWLARLLIVSGATALAWAAFQMVSAAWYQRQTEAALEDLRTRPARSAPDATTLSVGEPIGTLEIARLWLVWRCRRG